MGRISGAVKHDFRTYIRRYTSPNDKSENGYPHSNVYLTFTHQNQAFAAKTLDALATYIHYVDQSQVTLLMTCCFQQYILLQISDVIQLDIMLHSQVHKNE